MSDVKDFNASSSFSSSPLAASSSPGGKMPKSTVLKIVIPIVVILVLVAAALIVYFVMFGPEVKYGQAVVFAADINGTTYYLGPDGTSASKSPTKFVIESANSPSKITGQVGTYKKCYFRKHGTDVYFARINDQYQVTAMDSSQASSFEWKFAPNDNKGGVKTGKPPYTIIDSGGCGFVIDETSLNIVRGCKTDYGGVFGNKWEVKKIL